MTARYRVIVFVVLYFCALPAVTAGWAADEQRPRSEGGFFVNVWGQLEARSRAVDPLMADFRLMDFLTSEVVRGELEALDYQVRDIDALLERFRQDFDKERDRVLRERGKLGRFDVPLDGLRSIEADVAREVRKVLLPHQWDRLQQVDHRCQVRRSGLKTSLSRGALGQLVDVTPEQRVQLDSVGVRLGRELHELCLRRRVEALDHLYDVLSEDQRMELRRLTGGAYYGTDGNLELLCWQLNQRPVADANAEVDPYAGLRGEYAFVVHIDGTLRPRSDRGNRVRPVRPLVDVLLPLLVEDDIARLLAMDDEQLEGLEALSKRRNSTLNKLDRRYQDAYEAGKFADARAMRELKDDLAGQQRALYASLDREMRGLLREDQWEKVRQLSRELQMLRQGPIIALVSGEMGRTLNLTESQRSRLIERANEVRARLVQETSKMEDTAYKALFNVLTARQRELLDNHLGKPLYKSPGGVTVLLADLLPPTQE